MRQWPDFPDDELGRADDLLGQADALLRRHRGEPLLEPDPARPRAAPPTEAFDDDDLPILTEIVDTLELPADAFLTPEPELDRARAFASPPPAPDVQAPPFAPPQSALPAPQPVIPSPVVGSPAMAPPATEAEAEQRFAERLVELDTAIAREVEEWAARELPQIIARELDRLGERIQDEALAHLRATLLPEISARVSSLLDDRSPDGPPAL